MHCSKALQARGCACVSGQNLAVYATTEACCIACMGQLLPVLSWPTTLCSTAVGYPSQLAVHSNGVTWWECDAPLLYVSSGAPLDDTLCSRCVIGVSVMAGHVVRPGMGCRLHRHLLVASSVGSLVIPMTKHSQNLRLQHRTCSRSSVGLSERLV
jgi:hypothetical protein